MWTLIFEWIEYYMTEFGDLVRSMLVIRGERRK